MPRKISIKREGKSTTTAVVIPPKVKNAGLAKARKAKARKALARKKAQTKAEAEFRIWCSREKDALAAANANPDQPELRKEWIKLWHEQPIAVLRDEENGV